MRRDEFSPRIAATVLALVTVVAGLGACDGGKPPSDEDSTEQSMDDGIKDFDFANATVVDGEGEDHTFRDGSAVKEGYEGTDVGWHIAEGPVFADVDGDDDLDAALIYEWIAAAGASATSAYIWTYEDGKVDQDEYQIRGGNGGELSDLKAEADGFRITAVSRPLRAPAAERGGEKETFTIGFKDGYPVETAPSFGSVDRCVIDPDAPPGAAGDGTVPRVVPREDAPGIGEEGDFPKVTTVASMWNTEEWTLVRAERSDGSISCGWLPMDNVTQG